MKLKYLEKKYEIDDRVADLYDEMYDNNLLELSEEFGDFMEKDLSFLHKISKLINREGEI